MFQCVCIEDIMRVGKRFDAKIRNGKITNKFGYIEIICSMKTENRKKCSTFANCLKKYKMKTRCRQQRLRRNCAAAAYRYSIQGYGRYC